MKKKIEKNTMNNSNSLNQCLPIQSKMSAKTKKILEEVKENQIKEVDLVDKNISSFEDVPSICK